MKSLENNYQSLEFQEVPNPRYENFKNALIDHHPDIRDDIHHLFEFSSGQKQALKKQGEDPDELLNKQRNGILDKIRNDRPEHTLRLFNNDGTTISYTFRVENESLYIKNPIYQIGPAIYYLIDEDFGEENRYIKYTHQKVLRHEDSVGKIYEEVVSQKENFSQLKREILVPEPCCRIFYITTDGVVIDHAGFQIRSYYVSHNKTNYYFFDRESGSYYVFDQGPESHPTKATQDNGLLQMIQLVNNPKVRRI